MTDTFSDRMIAITLTGKEWFTLMARLADKPLSNKGVDLLRTAKDSLGEQVTAAAEGHDHNPIETRIINKLLADALAAGYNISVNDGEDTIVSHSREIGVIKGAMRSTDEDYLHFTILEPDLGNFRRVGWVRLIYGNGVDLISDYSDNSATEALVSGATKLAEEIEAQS